MLQVDGSSLGGLGISRQPDVLMFLGPRCVPIHCNLEKVELNGKEQKKSKRVS